MSADEEPTGITTNELARQLREVLIRFEGLVRRVEDKFVSREVFELRVAATDEKYKLVKDDVDTKVSQTDFNNLESRVKDLESDKQWLTRLVIGLVITALVALVVAVGGVPK